LAAFDLTTEVESDSPTDKVRRIRLIDEYKLRLTSTWS